MVGGEDAGRTQLESQDDLGYLFGRHSAEDRGRQIDYGGRAAGLAVLERTHEGIPPEEYPED